MAIETVKDPSRKVVLVHGYSDRGASFIQWAKVLREAGFTTETIEVVTYKSLTNEVTIKDLAEGFDRALTRKGLGGKTPFDVIVHSTGMLVVRAWLTANRDDDSRKNRLKHLIGFAPATWGSPLAHRGRGVLGSLFKGNKSPANENAPDFLEAGDLILDGLEVGSSFTWDLAHVDLFDPKKVFYGKDDTTPFPFIFCGNKPYGGFLRTHFVNRPGTDGTVRFAGVSLDSRKFVLDLTKSQDDRKRLDTPPSTNVDAPVIFVPDRNHATIMSDPDREMANFVVRALNVQTQKEFDTWKTEARKWSDPNTPKERFQHFVIRMTDERGDSIHDYHIQLFRVRGEQSTEIPFDLEMHPYERDKSYRSYHVDIRELQEIKDQVWMTITLSSGTFLVAYRGISNLNPRFPGSTDRPEVDETFEDSDDQRAFDARPTEIHLNLSKFLAQGSETKLFAEFTTTLVEIKVDREPLPFGKAIARLCKWENLTEHGL